MLGPANQLIQPFVSGPGSQVFHHHPLHRNCRTESWISLLTGCFRATGNRPFQSCAESSSKPPLSSPMHRARPPVQSSSGKFKMPQAPQSYVNMGMNMGMASVACISGCTCETTKFDGHHEENNYLVSEPEGAMHDHVWDMIGMGKEWGACYSVFHTPWFRSEAPKVFNGYFSTPRRCTPPLPQILTSAPPQSRPP